METSTLREREERASIALKTLVLLCGDLNEAAGRRGWGTADAVEAWLRRHVPDVAVEIAPGLCHEPRLVRELAVRHGAQRLVLGLCSSDFSQTEIEAAARKAGLDSLGIEVAVLGEHFRQPNDAQPTELAGIVLAAAVAKARAFPGSCPGDTRPVFKWGEKVSRRSLFSLPPVHYRPVARVEPGRCAAESGCHLCVAACPRQAMGLTDDGIGVDKPRCEGCGVCVAACPRGAISVAGHSPAQIELQVMTSLSIAPECLPERRVLFACRRSLQAWREKGRYIAPGWLPVEVPCAAMVPVAAILHCLARGASMVGLVPCASRCSLDQLETIKGRTDYCRQLLRAMGDAPERVSFVGPGSIRPLVGLPSAARQRAARDDGMPPPPMFGPGATVQALWDLAGGPDGSVALAHPSSPLGVVSINPAKCSGCGMCADTCPTEALRLERAEHGVALTFDAGLCTGCALCAECCPETSSAALRVDKLTDFARIRQARVTLNRSREARCVACGAPIAPEGMLQRIRDLLGPDAPSLSNTIGSYCLSCRGQRA